MKSIPASRCRATTACTADSIRASSAASSTSWPSRRAQIMSARSPGRGRLPACVAGIRPSAAAMSLHLSALIRHEQPALHLLLALWVELPQGLHLRANVVRQAVEAGLVDLDQVARGIAQVQLDHVAGQLDQMVAEGISVERA